MRFIVMHKVDAHTESGRPPDPELIQAMGKLVGTSKKEGVFLDGAGLHRSAKRARLRFRGGAREVTRGPYAGENELVSRLAMIRARTIDEAIDLASRFAAVLGDVEIEIGPVVEPWDLKLAPRPSHLEHERFLLLFKADAPFERGEPDTRAAGLADLAAELSREGTLLQLEGLAPSADGKRLAGPKGKRTWTDGPFAESKELISGFSILEVPSMADALAWAERYAAILVENEVDVRRMAR
jgi:hypothetical protein